MSFDKKVMHRRSNIELLEITTLRQDDYMPEAVEAAKEELESRQLSSNEMKELRSRLLHENLGKEEKAQQEKEAKELLNNKADELLDTLNPLTSKTLETSIRTVAIVFGAYWIYLIFHQGNFISYYFSEVAMDEWDPSILEAVIPILILPFGIFGFWMKKKYGWIIIAFYSTYFFTTILLGIFFPISLWSGIEGTSQYIFDFIENILGQLILHASIALTVIGLLFFMNKKNVLNVFTVSQKEKMMILGFSFFLSISFHSSFLIYLYN